MGRLSRDKVLDMIRTTVREQEPDAQIILLKRSSKQFIIQHLI